MIGQRIGVHPFSTHLDTSSHCCHLVLSAGSKHGQWWLCCFCSSHIDEQDSRTGSLIMIEIKHLQACHQAKKGQACVAGRLDLAAFKNYKTGRAKACLVDHQDTDLLFWLVCTPSGHAELVAVDD